MNYKGSYTVFYDDGYSEKGGSSLENLNLDKILPKIS